MRCSEPRKIHFSAHYTPPPISHELLSTRSMFVCSNSYQCFITSRLNDNKVSLRAKRDDKDHRTLPLWKKKGRYQKWKNNCFGGLEMRLLLWEHDETDKNSAIGFLILHLAGPYPSIKGFLKHASQIKCVIIPEHFVDRLKDF